MTRYTVRVEHKAIVHDEIVFILDANSPQEAIEILKNNNYESNYDFLSHSEEFEREDLETLWDEAEVEEDTDE